MCANFYPDRSNNKDFFLFWVNGPLKPLNVCTWVMLKVSQSDKVVRRKTDLVQAVIGLGNLRLTSVYSSLNHANLP